MSNRGRPKKSIDELKKSGSYRPSRHGPQIAAGEAGSAQPLPCPETLKGAAASHWTRLAAALVGRVEMADSPLLELACEYLAVEESCRGVLRDLDPTTPEHSRALRSATGAAAAADRILSKYALTPAARAKLPAPPPPRSPQYEYFFGSGQRTPKRPQFALDRMFPNGPPHTPVRPADLDPAPPKKPNPSKES